MLSSFKLVLGIIGNVASICSTLAPCPTFWRICRRRAVEDFSVMPYTVGLFCSLLWVWYAMPFISRHDFLPLLTVSATQASIRTVFVVLYITFSPWQKKVTILMWMGAIVGMIGVIVGITLLVFHGIHQAAFAGAVASFAGIASYASPLTIMRLVIKTKSIKYMPLLLSLAMFMTTTIWTVYGALKPDLFIVASSGTGLLLAVAQLSLYGVYYKSSSQHIAVHQDPKDVQLAAPREHV